MSDEGTFAMCGNPETFFGRGCQCRRERGHSNLHECDGYTFVAVENQTITGRMVKTHGWHSWSRTPPETEEET